jgi:hypothetical protein
MKKLHLSIGKDSIRPALMHIQVKDGFVYATNCHILVKFPIDEVFGSTEDITNDSHFYIDGKLWGKFKFYNAAFFTHKDGILSAWDKKGNDLGMIKTKNETELGARFPNCDQVIFSKEQQNESIDSISFDHELYFNLIEVFNFPVSFFKMCFYGQTKQIQVRPNDETMTNAIALIMPVKFN